jgi:hypothetical protein
MKKKVSILSLFLLLNIFLLSAQNKAIYENSDFDMLTLNHKTVAIVPFLTTLSLDKKVSADQRATLEKHEGYEAQNAMENFFLMKNTKRKSFVVDFQDVKNTNAILQKNGISYDNLDIYSTQELCDVLKVDAIISGKLILRALLSTGVDESFDLIAFLSGKSDYGKIIIKTSDGESGKLLWKYEQTINRKSGKNTYAIIEKMMKKASRKIPYDMERN